MPLNMRSTPAEGDREAWMEKIKECAGRVAQAIARLKPSRSALTITSNSNAGRRLDPASWKAHANKSSAADSNCRNAVDRKCPLVRLSQLESMSCRCCLTRNHGRHSSIEAKHCCYFVTVCLWKAIRSPTITICVIYLLSPKCATGGGNA